MRRAVLHLVALVMLLGIAGCSTAKTMQIVGTSMEPAIKDGAVVTYCVDPFDKVQPGDVIVYKRPGGGTAAGRAIGFIAKSAVPTLAVHGDADPETTTGVTRETYIGTVVLPAK